MERLFLLTRRVARAGSWVGGTLLLASAFIVTIDVVLRKFWGVTFGGADLLTGFALAIGSAWAFAFAFLSRAHIRIDTFYVHMPTRLRLAADFAGVVLMIGFFGMVLWYATGVVEQSIALGSRSMSTLQIPLAIPQVIWVAGLVFFIFTMLLTLAYAIQLVWHARHSELQRLIGSKSTDEEVAEERMLEGGGT